MDALAETLTWEAETLTTFLETSGMVTNLRVINLAGRQRMLGQRVSKLCLLLALVSGSRSCRPGGAQPGRGGCMQAATAFDPGGRRSCERMPIRTPEIERWQAESARTQWAEMVPFQRGQGAMTRCIEVSERLLDT